MNIDLRNLRLKHCLFVGLIGSLTAMPAQAQEAATPAPASESAATTFSVQGNTLLPASTLTEILVPLPPPVTLDAIGATVSRLQQAYREAGYGAVVVNLPEQTITEGVIRLEVIEGKLDDVYVQGNEFFSEENILHSLPSLKAGVTPNLLEVDANALQANENPAKSVRITFQPGQSAGLVDALVVAQDRKPTQYTLGLDNTGNDATGRYRASAAYQNANLFGRDHIFGLRGEFSPSQTAHSNAGSLSYLVPLYGNVAAVEFSASYSDVESKSIATAAGDALFAGKGAAAGLRYRRYLPKLGTLRQRVQVGVDLRHYQNECSVGVFGSAGCGSANADVDVRPITLAYDARSENLVANLQLSSNVWPGGSHGSQEDFEQARPDAKAKYSVLRGSLSSTYRIWWGSSFTLRNSFQYTRNALVSSEQNGEGGVDTVRGYEERELSGDKGVMSSVELGSPSLRLPDFAGANLPHQANGVVFVDWGRVINTHDTFCDSEGSTCRIASAGVGVRWNYHNQVFVRTDVARALKSGPQTDDGDYRLHFSLGCGF